MVGTLQAAALLCVLTGYPSVAISGIQVGSSTFAASFMDRLPCDHACWSLNESLYRDLCAVNPPLPPCCPPDRVFFTAAFDSLFYLCSAPPS